jgi:hypothetical protein
MTSVVNFMPQSVQFRVRKDDLCKACKERGLDASGLVEKLRGRLVEFLKSSKMEEQTEAKAAQASVQNDVTNKVSQTDNLNLGCCSHDGQSGLNTELLVKPEILTSCLATLKAIFFYLLHNVSTPNQCRKFSCDTVVCKHFATYQDYPNYRWDLIRLPKG